MNPFLSIWRYYFPLSNRYAIPDAYKSKNAIATYQARRKAREAYPQSWDEYRAALKQCGLVEERRQMREAERAAQCR